MPNPVKDLGVIDKFVETFSSYIDSGFGLLGGEVEFLTAIIIAIDITLAGLYWAMGSDTSVIGKFLKKVMYVGVFALIITNFSGLSEIIFKSFGGLGLQATSSGMSHEDLLRPGFIANTGFQAAHPLLTEIGKLTGPVKFFTNIVLIGVLALAWLITMFAFFFLAIQLFVTVIEFKLTTLAGFILIPFALWNKTSFLAEKVLGNVVASGIKLMVLAIIVGIGATIFGDITAAFHRPDVFINNVKQPQVPIELADAASVILASMALLAMGLFGPGIATGLVSGAPQLGAGVAVGTMAAVGAGALAGGAVAGAVGKGGMKTATSSVKAGASMAGGSKLAFALGKMSTGSEGLKGNIAGAAAVAQAGVMSVAKKAGGKALAAGGAISTAHGNGARGAMRALSKGMKPATPSVAGGPKAQPDWAKKLKSGQHTRNAGRHAAHAMRGNGGGSASGPALNPDG